MIMNINNMNKKINKRTSSYSSIVFYKSYSSGFYNENTYYSHLRRLKYLIDSEICEDPYNGLRKIKVTFIDPFVLCVECDLIALAVMRLLMMYAYNTRFKNAKFTIGYVLKTPKDNVCYTICDAISLMDYNHKPVPSMGLYNKIYEVIAKKAEEYADGVLSGLIIRVYLLEMTEKVIDVDLTYDQIDKQIWELMNSGIGGGPPPKVVSMVRKVRKRGYSNHITDLKSTSKECSPFIVADIETLLINQIHVPYAAGLLVVRPGDNVATLPDSEIHTYFSEDHIIIIPNSFEERSNRMFFQFIERITVISERRKIKTVYFHNFSGFDGILLLKFYASCGNNYTFKPLLRNHKLYELSIFRGKKLLFHIRDSCTLLPNSLDTLAKTLCPQLGSKGSISHEDVAVSNLQEQRNDLLDYMKQDIRLLGGVMLKAQEIYWDPYKLDITKCLTLSAVAIKIFRMKYYDPKTFPIHIPSRNEDTFIRRGFYGGHTDVYIPYGEDLYYYDVNSLYPYIMKTYPMPGGVPVWNGKLQGQELSKLYGFIEAFVVCPSTINRPFLPYKDKNKTLLFPKGQFVGVYYSEELIYARNLGYEIYPLRGYLFEKKATPFESFVSSIFGKRQEAKKAGNEAMGYVYKILMNSLYGRFGINPESSITEVCKKERYEYLIKSQDHFRGGDKLSEDYYIATYVTNKGDKISEWNPPKLSAVQLSAAITACSRIHMHKYISRPDCLYTDTDSVILRSPLPEDEVSSTELGKLKLEHRVYKAICLAPKAYALETKDGDIIKHKGAAKHFVNLEWFEK